MNKPLSYDSSRQQISSDGVPDASVNPTPAFEYSSIDPPPPVCPPPLMRPPAYLYPPPSAFLAPTPVQRSWPARRLALTGFFLGLAGILLWIIPAIGDLVAMAGITFSILGWRTPTHKWLARAGCALSLAALALGIYNSALGSALFPH